MLGNLDSATAEKFKDPVVLGFLISRLVEERENTNRLMKTLIERIEYLEKKIAALSAAGAPNKQAGEIIMSEIDEDLYQFVKAMGKVCANEVMKQFKYKGTNAASARLNKLVNMGLLNKKQAGKRVYFYPLS